MNTFLAKTGSKPSNSHYHVGMCNLGRVLTLPPPPPPPPKLNPALVKITNT